MKVVYIVLSDQIFTCDFFFFAIHDVLIMKLNNFYDICRFIAITVVLGETKLLQLLRNCCLIVIHIV